MTAWTVTLRGMWYHWGRSLAVLSLATVAVATAVLAPAYARAAQRSVLLDGLAGAAPTTTDLVITADTPADAALAPVSGTKRAIANTVFGYPILRSAFRAPVASVETEATFGESADLLAAKVAFREDVCAHLVIAGECPYMEGQVLVGAATAGEYGIEAGQRITLRPAVRNGRVGTPRIVTVMGTYVPADADDAYWGRSAYFSSGHSGVDSVSTRVQALFAAGEEDVRALGADARVRVEYPLDPTALTLDDVAGARSELTLLGQELAATGGLQVTSTLPGVLESVLAERRAVAQGVPMVAVPLVLLSVFVLFLVVALIIEERSADLALAELRGYPVASAARFGFAETLVLIGLAAPLGLVVGMLGVEVAAVTFLATGSGVEITGSVLAAGAAAVGVAALAAIGAGWRTVRRPIVGLLGGVRRRWRWGMAGLEAVAVTASVLVLWQALGDRSSPLALLAAPLLAVVAGLVAARLVGGYARFTVGRAGRRGRLVALLSSARLARHPAGVRLTVVLTVAVSLLTFAAVVWDAATEARAEYARSTMGADRVYTVDIAHPDALVAAIRRADPGGVSTMAVVRGRAYYGGGSVELMGVDSTRFASVVDWSGQSQGALTDLAGRLRPDEFSSIVVKGRIEVDVTVSALRSDKPLRLLVVVSSPGEPPRVASLGVLAVGAHGYATALPGCAAGCRVLGLGISRTPGTSDQFAVDVEVSALRGPDGPLDAGFAAPGHWRAMASGAPHAEFSVRSGAVLALSARSADARDLIAEYATAPDVLPAVVAGATFAGDGGSGTFDFPALVDKPQRFGLVSRVEWLPRVGVRGILFDLDYAVRSAERTTSVADMDNLRYEVWAAPSAPADLGARLTAAGARVVETDSISQTLHRLGRMAPALILGLYLLAGIAAVLLAASTVVLTASLGAKARRGELAALRLAGVPAGMLRRAVAWEYGVLVATPLLVGSLAGVCGAIVMSPALQVGSGTDPVGTGRLLAATGPGWSWLALIAIVGCLVLAVALVVRMLTAATPTQPRGENR